MSDIYQVLMDCAGAGEAFDRHLLASVLAKGIGEADRPLSHAVGLRRAELKRLCAAYFPDAATLLEGVPEECGEEAPEEPDLRRLLLSHATRPGSDEAAWLAAMVARRSREPDHLWVGLGLSCRADLSALLHRHFASLAQRNVRDMKWKKFLYRQLCEEEGITVCRSPVCDACSDFALCFGPEE